MTTTPSPLVGCAIGDMIGKFAETKSPQDIEWDGVTVMPGNYHHMKGVYYSPDTLLNRVGVPTDDTQMSRLLGAVLRDSGGYDPSVAASYYADWLRGKAYVGEPRGMGGTLKKAITRLVEGTATWETCGERLPLVGPAGTGTAMRAGVLGCLRNVDEVTGASTTDAKITHDHPEAVAASIAMAFTVNYALEHRSLGNVYRALLHLFDRLRMGHTPMAWALRFAGASHHEVLQLGSEFTERWCIRENAVSITATALYCAVKACNFQEGIESAVRMGGDTDTRAAMTGVILGSLFGLEKMPKTWLDALYERDDIIREDQELMRVFRGYP